MIKVFLVNLHVCASFSYSRTRHTPKSYLCAQLCKLSQKSI